MLRWLRRYLNPSIQAAKPKNSASVERAPSDGDALYRRSLTMAFGAEEAAEIEQQLAGYHRERAYRAHVERMERVVELRRRELAAKDAFDSLR